VRSYDRDFSKGTALQPNYAQGQFQVDFEQRINFEALRKDRVSKVRALMKESDLDAVVTWRIENVRYLTSARLMLWPLHGGPSHYCTVLPRDHDPILIISGGDYERCRSTMPWIRDIYPIPIMEEDGLIESAVSTTFKQVFERHALEKGRIGLDALSFSIFESYRRNFPKANFISCEMLLKNARMRKTSDEIRLINEATAMTEAGLASAIEKIKPGVTEYEVASEYMRVIFAAGAETLHTAQPYVTSGEHLSPPFRLATDKRIRYGDLVFIDNGACFNGYFSDMGRTVICGKASEKQREIYRVVYESLMASFKAVRPRAKTSDVARACRERAAEFGYDKHFLLLFIGHGIGVAPAEPPFIGEPTVPGAREVELEPGMVIALEPLVNVPGVKGGGGVRIEDILVVTEAGSEVLSRLPYDEQLLK